MNPETIEALLGLAIMGGIIAIVLLIRRFIRGKKKKKTGITTKYVKKGKFDYSDPKTIIILLEKQIEDYEEIKNLINKAKTEIRISAKILHNDSFNASFKLSNEYFEIYNLVRLEFTTIEIQMETNKEILQSIIKVLKTKLFDKPNT